MIPRHVFISFCVYGSTELDDLNWIEWDGMGWDLIGRHGIGSGK